MFDRYTDRSRRVIVLAQEQARILRHSVIDVDHLLLGLAAEGGGVACQALEKTGVTAEAVRSAVATARPAVIAVPPNPPFTREAKRALEAGLRESVKLGHPYIGTEHLLLGVLADCGERPESPCWAVLRTCGVTAGDVRAEVMVLLRGYGEVPAPAADDDPRMAAVGVLLEDIGGQLAEIGRKLNQARELLGMPG